MRTPTTDPQGHQVAASGFPAQSPTEAPPPRPFSRHPMSGPLRKVVRRARQLRTPRLSSYAPVSMLELPDHTPSRACIPAIDFHTHLGRWLSDSGGWMEHDVVRLLDLMDACNVEAMVNLDGRWGPELEENLDRYDRTHPGRFFSFCHLDWRLLDQPHGEDRLAESLRQSVASRGTWVEGMEGPGDDGHRSRPPHPAERPAADAHLDGSRGTRCPRPHPCGGPCRILPSS